MFKRDGVIVLDDGSIYRQIPTTSKSGKLKYNGKQMLVEFFIGKIVTGEDIAFVCYKDFDSSNISLDNLDFITVSDISNFNLSLLSRMISYDSVSGHFKRRYNTKGHGVGARADSKGPMGYREIRISYDGNMVFRKLAHIVAYAIEHDGYSDMLIDHKDRCKSNNSILNLREVSYIQNANNSGARTDLPKGIKLTRAGKYQVSVTFNYVTQHIGTFCTVEEAVSARKHSESNMLIN